MRIWDICCGTKSVSKVWKEHGHEALTLDIDPKCSPDICTDIMSWEYTDFSLEDPDVIWCSPPCTHYSIARSKAKTPRDLEGSDQKVQRCLDIIAYWRPKYWFIENPQTGLLKNRAVVQGLNFKDVDYCMYGAPYRKRTRLWTNCTWTPRPLCIHTSHPMTAQKGPSKRFGELIQGDDCSLHTLHSIPQGLTMEIMLHCNEAQANP
jgi:hypothetical protein